MPIEVSVGGGNGQEVVVPADSQPLLARLEPVSILLVRLLQRAG